MALDEALASTVTNRLLAQLEKPRGGEEARQAASGTSSGE